MIASLIGYSDILAEGDYKEHIDEAAHRAGNMFRYLQDEQSKLIQEVIDKFEQPANEFINQEITECFVINHFENIFFNFFNIFSIISNEEFNDIIRKSK